MRNEYIYFMPYVAFVSGHEKYKTCCALFTLGY